MNTLLWIIQIALSALYLAGGGFKLSNPAELAKQTPEIPLGGWRVLGIIEVLGAVLLIVPGAMKWMPMLTPIAAAVLALETLGLAAMFARKSVKIAVTNPLVWALPMGLLAAFVAYGRYV